MLRIHVNDPTLLDDLREALAAAECSTVQLGEDTLLVTHPLGNDQSESRQELAFFLKSWQATRPEARVELLG